mgnify:CR=1 FL=1
MLHKQEADELGAHLKKIVDTERKADQRRKAPNSQKGGVLVGVEGMLVGSFHKVCPDANY